ncbi:MAG: hypothetical protein LBM64_09960, partial [Deltaproteobacteria bacterium]|nr:hypothetical protein [Deltaproteobacteria bacterium]
MKRFFLSCLIVGATFALTACGGGGGGGGGSASLPPAMTKDDLGFTAAMKGAAVQAGNSNIAQSTKAVTDVSALTWSHGTGAGGSFVIKDDQNNVIVTFATGDNTDVYLYEIEQGKNLIVGETDVTDDMISKINAVVRDQVLLEARKYNNEQISDDPDYIEFLTGEVRNGKTFLIVNNDLVALEHSTFGAWIVEQVWQGDYVGGSLRDRKSLTSEGHILSMEPLYGGLDAQKATPTNGEFTGNAVAMLTHYAYEPDFGTNTFFNNATAKLTVTGSTGELVVNLPKYFDVTWSGVDIVSSALGDWSNDSLTTTISNITDDSRNWNSLDLTEGQVAGTFYTGNGNSSNAGEAVGKFQAYGQFAKEKEGEITIS